MNDNSMREMVKISFFKSSEKQQSEVKCIPVVGLHKRGCAGEGLLNLKSQKIILVGFKLLKSLLGLSDHTHSSPYCGKQGGCGCTQIWELWWDHWIAHESNNLSIMRYVFTYQIISSPTVNSWQLEENSVQEDKSVTRWLVLHQCNSCHHKQHWP